MSCYGYASLKTELTWCFLALFIVEVLLSIAINKLWLYIRDHINILSSYISPNGFNICWWFLPKLINVLVVAKVIGNLLIVLLHVNILARIFLCNEELPLISCFWVLLWTWIFLNIQYNMNHYHYYLWCWNCPNLTSWRPVRKALVFLW